VESPKSNEGGSKAFTRLEQTENYQRAFPDAPIQKDTDLRKTPT
jgi:hypothetical protein